MFDSAALRDEAIAAIAAASDLAALDTVRVEYLGKKGKIIAILKTMGSLSPEERKATGAAVNKAKEDVSAAIDVRFETLNREAINARLASETEDITLPVRETARGKIHPITQTIEEMITICADLGFSVVEGPEIETDYYNFEALNFPAHHPAREMHDTFYLAGEEKPVLRTHTSPVQIRTMQNGTPPFRVIAPGATYRCDSDQTHTPKFHQIEGLVIDKNIHMGHLKGCLSQIFEAFFEVDTLPMRFRPSYFPFTEPSAEVDIGCKKDKESLIIGGGNDWLEIAGCGMVHPNVLKECGLDPDEWQGFAFGMGVERMAMLKYGIPDLRQFFQSDARWLDHYGFEPLNTPNLVSGLGR